MRYFKPSLGISSGCNCLQSPISLSLIFRIYKEYRNVRQWGCDADNQGDMDKFMQQVDSKEKEIEKLRQDLEKFIV